MNAIVAALLNRVHSLVLRPSCQLGMALALGLCSAAAQAQVQGAGSSLVRDLLGSWATQHGSAFGGASYEVTGSSAGVSRVREQLVDFGVTDVPLTGPALRQAGLLQLPLAGAAVIVIANLPELAGQPIKLDGATLADIYTGVITQWNHTQIAALNPDLKLPSRPIVPLWRSDGSGQSYIFSTYLSRSSTPWRRTTSATQSLNLSVGKGVKGGKALLESAKATPGAVAYEGLGAATKSGLTVASLLNAAGKYVNPTTTSIADALGAARWSADGAADLDGSAGAGSYPMTAVAYALVPKVSKAGRASALSFLQVAVLKGDAQTRLTGFVPLPPAARDYVSALR